ncbi:C-C motif chemokine 24-like [Danio rerio]|uniref:C-C motif chemokine 24-like n=1 Tax=Danio rerio TaxID=7955 RepID=A0AC58I5Z8_DANRE
MRSFCIFIILLALVALCSAVSQIECCFSFSTVRIPVNQVQSYQTTHFECHKKGIVFITKIQKEICTDPTEEWVQRLMGLVDARYILQTTKSGLVDTHRSKPLHEMPETIPETDAMAKTAALIKTTDMPLDETTLTSILKESQDWRDVDTTQENSKTQSAYFCM